MWCTFCVSLRCKEQQKGTGWGDLNPKNRVAKPFFENRRKRKHSGKLKFGRFKSHRQLTAVETIKMFLKLAKGS